MDARRYGMSLRYLTSERRERARYKVELEKRNSISTSNHALSCLLHKHADNEIFDDFPKISEHFSKISEDSPKILRRPYERF